MLNKKRKRFLFRDKREEYQRIKKREKQIFNRQFKYLKPSQKPVEQLAPDLYEFYLKRLQLDKWINEFNVRLLVDDLKKSDFFKAVIMAYIDRNPQIVEFFESYKVANELISKERSEKQLKINEQAQTQQKDFGLVELSDNEISEIFDILEKDFDHV